MKERLKNILDRLLKYKNLVFPVMVVALSAVTVVIALGAGGARQDKLAAFESSREEQGTEETSEATEAIEQDTPLVNNEDPDITALIMLFFNSRANGDEQGLRSCFEKVSDTDLLRWMATAKYTESFPLIEIYTKPGFYEGDTIAYVYFKMVFTGKEAEYPGLQLFYITRDEEGKVHFKSSDVSDEVNAYVEKVSSEADVADLRNNIKVEYDELMTEQPDLLAYLQEIDQLVGEEIGVKLGQIRAEEEANQEQESTGQPVEGEETETSPTESQEPEATPEPTLEPTPEPTPTPVPERKPKYVETTENVNIRQSDSTNSEILGTAKIGTWYDFVEHLDNGWTKIRYNKSYAYINTKFLKDIYEDDSSTSEDNNSSTEQAVGKVTAKGTVNIRSGPGTDYEKIGVLAGGESLDSYGESGEWTKVKVQNKFGYIKTEFLLK